ncbi:type IX secretion system PorP/SprF family membrane protein [Leeuwenhoekiella aestuarii]|uniref:Type IX secretion system PorP/SprF family membrane protein n=1 Tax=Leeuwenhoekiella aestuarii TaxID=2249426 RepID=A0A4Q0NPK4_9FLAO|nr:PorP/SprF family type IX secretion system membrane protein [Leeuwenhoekiella aestuarii]RXG11720.1 type IX secretion system PorP/SprF family membrane protein [Leeuwenhoekiella aestuarii]RXG12775.1 type IX secretion system PorP/SprF family membrane protein [Leeuwenhoekiella aestuarii]
MKINTLTFVAILLLAPFWPTHSLAQQQPVFSEYNYNTIILNPAHAGYYNNSEFTLSNQNSYSGFDGAPATFNATLNLTLDNENVGLGGGFLSDQIGVTSINSAFVSYAYKLYFGQQAQAPRYHNYNPNIFSFGITAGIFNYTENLTELGITDDPNFQQDIKGTVPTVGMGILFNRNQLYAGLSVPNLLGNSLAPDDSIEINTAAYAYAGYRIYTGVFDELEIKPNFLLRYETGAPLSIDINTIFNYKNLVEFGGGYRTSSAVNVLAGVYLFNNLRFVYNYTMPLRESPLPATHGLVLSVRLGEGYSR